MAVDIGTIGVWSSYRPFGAERAGEAAKLVEQLGYGAWWVGGSPHVPDIRPVLEATSTLVAATGILNVWANEPGETAEADAALRADFPERFMLDLAGERAAGTHSYFVPVEHTHLARERLGPGKLVAPEVACVVDSDAARARTVARQYAKLYLGLRNYTQNLLRFGFSEADIGGGGSARLIDAVIPHGSAEQIAEVVRAHLDAGADHVCLQPLGEEGIPRASWTALAKVLLD